MVGNWTAHLMTRHGTAERELSELARDEIRLTEAHGFYHSEYDSSLDHWHDEFGQLHKRQRHGPTNPATA